MGKPQTPKKQNPKKKESLAASNGVTKAKPTAAPKLQLIPEEQLKNLTRSQKKRIAQKLKRALTEQGVKDLSTIDSSDARIKAFFDKLQSNKVAQPKATKSPAKKETKPPMKAKTPIKKQGAKSPQGKKTPNKSPKAN